MKRILSMDGGAVRAIIQGRVLEAIEQMQSLGTTRIPGPGNDVADPGQTELAYSEVSTAAMATATMEVPTTAEREAERRSVAVIIGIRLIVRLGIIAVAAKPSTAVPMTAMPPTTATAPVMYLLDVGRLRHL